MIFGNLKKLLSTKVGLIGAIIGIIIMLIPTYFLTWKDRDIIKNGIGDEKFYFILSLDLVLAVLFGIFLAGTIYKIKYFGDKKASKLGIIGGFLGILFGGCASCSLTFASVLGLGAFVSFLPFEPFMVKIFSSLLMLYVCFTTLKNLETCNLKPKKS